ncbi:restriction endonuclease subunit S [Candidatus Cloacimonadaceae bacterium]
MKHDFIKFSELFKEPLKNGLNRPTKDRGSGYKMVNMGEIFAYDRIFNIDMELVEVSEKERHYFLEKGDLLFARQSLVLSGAGKCSIFMGAPELITFEGHIIRARLNHSVCEPMFYYYYFNSYNGRKNIESIVEQVSAAGIRGSDLSNLMVPYPSLETQKEIAHILGTLDDKIELNRKMNKTLEEIAQALFKHWFIDFEFPNEEGKPYKSSGGEMIDSELGLIPKGWRVSTIGDMCSFEYGKSLASNSRISGKYPVMGSNGQIGWHDEPLVKGPGIVIGRKGNPGIVQWVHNDFFPIDTTFYAIPRLAAIPLIYIYYILCAAELHTYNSDSAVPGLNRDVALNIQIINPSNIVLHNFSRIISILFDKLNVFSKQISVLPSMKQQLLTSLFSQNTEIINIR